MRVLVLSHQPALSPNVITEVALRAQADTSPVLVVAPAPPSRGPTPAWDGRERRLARRHLRDSVDALKGFGMPARGQIGSSDPIEALVSAHRSFHSEQVIIATPPMPVFDWIKEGVLETARERVDVPVSHVVAHAPTNHRDPLHPGTVIRLYHFAEPHEAETLKRDGFAADDQPGSAAGIWMVEKKAGRGGRGKIAFGMDVPIEAVRRYEREPGFHDERRFLVPAGILSMLGPLAPLDE